MTIDLETLKDADKSTELQDDIDVITAGQLLREARIALGINIQQVSDNIHLKLSVINNIEQSVVDKGISPTFMRGYIRCYARYLKIAEDDVMRAYDCENAACEQQAELQSFSRRTKLEAHDNRLMLVSYGIIGFMLIAFLVWGLRDTDTDVMIPLLEPSTVETETITPKSSIVVIDAETPKLSTASTAQNVELDVIEELEVEELEIEEIEKPVAVASNQNNVVTNTPEQSLILTFVGDCWVQIIDNDGKTLVTGVKKAGQSIELQGLAPLSIKLGAPEFATLSYAGKPVDLSIFKQGKLAKFKLPFEA